MLSPLSLDRNLSSDPKKMRDFCALLPRVEPRRPRPASARGGFIITTIGVVLVVGSPGVGGDVGSPVSPVFGTSVMVEFAKASSSSRKKSSKVNTAIYPLLKSFYALAKSDQCRVGNFLYGDRDCVIAVPPSFPAPEQVDERQQKKPSGVRRACRTLCPRWTSSFPQGTFGLRLPGRVTGLRASPTARDEYLIVYLH